MSDVYELAKSEQVQDVDRETPYENNKYLSMISILVSIQIRNNPWFSSISPVSTTVVHSLM